MNPVSGQIDALVKLMDAAELRHRVISHNLANVKTPGYHRLEVVFEDLLEQAGNGSRSGQQPRQPFVREQAGLMQRADGNNVDIDRETVELDKNALSYETYSQLVAAQLQIMRRAIEG